jgi:hypothetical protein
MISERAFAKSFDSFWHELLPLLTPRFVALFNEAYENVLFDDQGNELESLPVPDSILHPDVVAEFAFRLARIARIEKITLEKIQSEKALVERAELEALELIQKYEGGQPVDLIQLSEPELAEGMRLCGRYCGLYGAFPTDSVVEFCPAFPGAGFLNSSEGDIAIADCLIEVKTTTRKPAGKDIRQLIVYAALDANSGNKRWTHFGIFNPRRGTLHHVEIDPLVLRLSGGQPRSDVFAELISFAESNEPAIDRRF